MGKFLGRDWFVMKRLIKLFGLVFVLGVCVFMPQLATAADITWYTNNPGATSFSISTAAQFEGLAQLVRLHPGSVLASGDNFSGKTVNLANNINLGEFKTPVGDGYWNVTPFEGTFDGKEHTISLNMNVSSKDNVTTVGLFGTNKGMVRNLKVSGTIVGETQTTGGVVAYNDGGTVENCTSTVSVKSTIRGSQPSVGGVVGHNLNSGIVKDCTNEGTVLSVVGHIGGVVGLNRARIENCTNTGAVSSEVGDRLGGVVGFNDGGSVKYSTNSGAVSATSNESYASAGGVVGLSRGNSTIENCTNTGAVTHAGKVENGLGGVVGRNESDSLVKGSTNNGGIVSVTGTVSGKRYIGGVVGYNDGGKVETCTWVKGSGGDATFGIGEPASNNGVTIIGSAIPVTGVTLSHKSVTLIAGQGFNLTATVAPAEATNKNVTWASSAPTIVEISGTGATVVLKTLNAGSATITVTTSDGEKKATCEVTVKAQHIEPVKPDLPDDTNPEVKPAAPEITTLPENATDDEKQKAINNAAELMPKMKAADFEVSGGMVRLNGSLTMELAKQARKTTEDLETLPLPVFSADVTENGKIAAIGFELTGNEFFAKNPSDVLLMKVVSSDKGVLFDYEDTPSDFDDGEFTVMKGGNVHTGAIVAGEKYQLVLFIKDGESYDLDLDENGVVVDPLALVGAAENADDDDKKPSGGCSAGYFAPFALVPFVLRKRK